MKIDTSAFSFNCSCGRRHTAPLKEIVLEPGAFKKIADILAAHGLDIARGVAVYDTTTYSLFAEHPPCKKNVILDPDGLHADEHGIELIKKELVPADFYMAVGCGTLHDLTRNAAFGCDRPFISVPTACSADAFASGTCSMTLSGRKVTVPSRAPMIIIADSDILAAAPMKLTRAGVGDIIGKYIARADWRISNILSGEPYCETIVDMQIKAVDMVMGSCDGFLAGETEAYEHLMYGLILSGLTMQMWGDSRPASGAEHYVSHFWEMGGLGVPCEAMHGEKVGVATLLVLKRYAQIAAMGAAFPDMLDWHAPLEDVIPYMGALWGVLEKENTPDSLERFTLEHLKKSWPEVVDVLKLLPKYEQVLALYKKIGAMSTMEEIGLSEGNIADSMRYSPYVRNRVTVLRIASRRADKK